MSPRSLARLAAAAAGAAFTAAFAGCSGAPAPDREPRLIGNELVEQTRGREVRVPRGTVAAADPRSDLLLRFEQLVPVDDPGAAPADAASQLTEALQRAEALLLARERLLQEFTAANAADDAHLHTLHRASASFGRDVQRLVVELGQLGFTDDELRATNQDRRPGESNGFPALLRLLQAHYEREQDDFARRRRLASEHTVTVQARIEPRGKQPKYLHIDGYDHLAIGDMEPQYGGFLGVSRHELASLQRNLRTVENAAGVLRSIDGLGERLRQRIDALRTTLRDGLLQLAQRARRQPASFVADLQQAMQRLVDDDATTAEQKAAAQQVLAALQQVAGMAEAWQALAGKADAALTALNQGGGRLSDLVGVAGALRQQAKELLAAGKALLDGIPKAPAVLDQVRAGLATTGVPLPPELAPFAAALAAEERQLLQLLGTWNALLDAADASAAPIAAGPAHIDDAVFLPLQNAPDARIRLGATDVREGDRVHVEAIYQPTGSDDRGKRVTETWDVEVERFGFYPRVGAELIFARADTGTADAKSWKANAAAVAELHHRFRDPTALGDLWNVLDPSFGVHLASLDQGDQNVEFGLGVNVSLFAGFVTAGYGWNLAASENGDYWFVGIDLINVLGQAQGLLGGN